MSLMVPVALFGWIPVVLLLFAALPSRRAMLTAFFAAWMFLPNTGYHVEGLPAYTKMSATALGVLLATAMFDPNRLFSLRLSKLDIPMIVWWLCPMASSLSNDLGVYDGLSAVFQQAVTWGIPYAIGRMYLRSLDDLRELAVALFVGGLVYTPFCLWEVRMSPQLNQWVYGFGGTGTEYAQELGKWGSRPHVFMGTALAVGLFMTAATLSGLWLWTSGAIRRVGRFAAGPAVAWLAGITVLCKNMGALALLVAGVGALFTAKWLHTRVLVLALVAAAPAYMFLRATGIWSGDSLVALSSLVHERRGQSLQSRITNDGMLVERALQKPVFGWGGWGRARVYEEDWKGDLVDVAVTDGLWIIALGNTGLVGLTAITAAMLLPAALVLYRLPKRTWWQPTAAPAVVLATLVVLYALDNLFNAMLNPIYVVTAGALTNLCLVIRVAAAAPLAAQQARVWPAVPAGPDARYVAATGRRRKPVTKTL